MADKKTALITGSYGGLGTCFVNIHASAGGNLILVGRSQTKLDEQKAEVEEKYGVHADTIAADLSKKDDVEKVYNTCKENGWQVDYLINNAGFGGQGDFARERTMEQDMSMIAVNIECPTILCKLFLPDFINRGSGKVLNVSSTAAIMPGPLQAVYYATKSYVTSWSNLLTSSLLFRQRKQMKIALYSETKTCCFHLSATTSQCGIILSLNLQRGYPILM